MMPVMSSRSYSDATIWSVALGASLTIVIFFHVYSTGHRSCQVATVDKLARSC